MGREKKDKSRLDTPTKVAIRARRAQSVADGKPLSMKALAKLFDVSASTVCHAIASPRDRVSFPKGQDPRGRKRTKPTKDGVKKQFVLLVLHTEHPAYPLH